MRVPSPEYTTDWEELLAASASVGTGVCSYATTTAIAMSTTKPPMIPSVTPMALRSVQCRHQLPLTLGALEAWLRGRPLPGAGGLVVVPALPSRARGPAGGRAPR